MRPSRVLPRAVLAGFLVASIGLSACGRRGPLEPPPGAVNDAAAGQTAPAGQAPGGPPGAAPAEPEQPFFLDFLL